MRRRAPLARELGRLSVYMRPPSLRNTSQIAAQFFNFKLSKSRAPPARNSAGFITQSIARPRGGRGSSLALSRLLECTQMIINFGDISNKVAPGARRPARHTPPARAAGVCLLGGTRDAFV